VTIARNTSGIHVIMKRNIKDSSLNVSSFNNSEGDDRDRGSWDESSDESGP
jgi:hypothetical protein